MPPLYGFGVLFVFLLSSVSFTFAGDLKPFEGQSQLVEFSCIDPHDYPYLEEILIENAHLTPDFGPYGQLLRYKGHTNVGGKTTRESAMVIYMFATGPEEDDPWMAVFFGCTTMTVANGDKIFSEWQSVWYEGHSLYIIRETIVGGTGRFEGATGIIHGTPDVVINPMEIIIS